MLVMAQKKVQNFRWLPLIIEGIVVIALAVIFIFSNHLPTAAPDKQAVPEITEEPVSSPEPTEEPSPEPTAEPTQTPTITPTETPAMIDPIAYFLQDTNQERYAQWIKDLSGDAPVLINGEEHTITTRYSYAMFGNQDL